MLNFMYPASDSREVQIETLAEIFLNKFFAIYY